MKTVNCDYCRLPFKVRLAAPAASSPAVPARHYCCTGCAMLARVPVDDKGQFPVNAHLISALATGFLFFNQLLFWLLAVLLAQQQKHALTARFLWISAVVAIAVWVAVALVQWREHAARASDYIVLIIALGVHAWMLFSQTPPTLWPMSLANATLLAWTTRGAWHRRKR